MGVISYQTGNYKRRLVFPLDANYFVQFPRNRFRRVAMERRNCLNIKLLTKRGAYVLLLGSFTIIFGATIVVLCVFSFSLGSSIYILGALSQILGALTQILGALTKIFGALTQILGAFIIMIGPHVTLFGLKLNQTLFNQLKYKI